MRADHFLGNRPLKLVGPDGAPASTAGPAVASKPRKNVESSPEGGSASPQTSRVEMHGRASMNDGASPEEEEGMLDADAREAAREVGAAAAADVLLATMNHKTLIIWKNYNLTKLTQTKPQ